MDLSSLRNLEDKLIQLCDDENIAGIKKFLNPFLKEKEARICFRFQIFPCIKRGKFEAAKTLIPILGLSYIPQAEEIVVYLINNDLLLENGWVNVLKKGRANFFPMFGDSSIFRIIALKPNWMEYFEAICCAGSFSQEKRNDAVVALLFDSFFLLDTFPHIKEIWKYFYDTCPQLCKDTIQRFPTDIAESEDIFFISMAVEQDVNLLQHIKNHVTYPFTRYILEKRPEYYASLDIKTQMKLLPAHFEEVDAEWMFLFLRNAQELQMILPSSPFRWISEARCAVDNFIEDTKPYAAILLGEEYIKNMPTPLVSIVLSVVEDELTVKEYTLRRIFEKLPR